MALHQDAVWRRDMERSWKDVISKNRPELCKMIDTEGDFIDHLEGLKVFNNRTCQSFKSKTGRYNQVSAILTALSKRPFEDFIKFCEALEKSNQGHVVNNCLSLHPQPPVTTPTDPVVMPTNSTQADARPDARPEGGEEAPLNHPLTNVWRDLIRDNYPGLVGAINPDDGLITYLVGKKVIMEWMQDTFKEKIGPSARASAILDHLILKRPFEDFIKFCDALVETNQKHVVDKYFSLGRPIADQSDVFLGKVQPYVIDSKQEMKKLLIRYNSLSGLDWKATFVETRSELVEVIDASNDFINLLHGLGIFNTISFETCQEREDIFKRAEFILDYMRRRPDDDFLRFCVALAKSNQSHVIDFLVDHRIERPPCDLLSLQIQPETRGAGEGGLRGGAGGGGREEGRRRDETPIKEFNAVQPVDDRPMETGTNEQHERGLDFPRLGHHEMLVTMLQQQQPERSFDLPRLGHHEMLVMHQHQQQPQISCNARPQPPQSIDLHPPQRICHPEDTGNDEGGNHPGTMLESTVNNVLPMSEEPVCEYMDEQTSQIIPGNSQGPVEIHNVKMRRCNKDFYESRHKIAYPMCRRVRGKCVIVNTENVQGMNRRYGTETDGYLLNRLFTKLNFDVQELNDFTAEEIRQKMRQLSKDETLRNDQCLVLFVMSHGQTIRMGSGELVDCIYGRDGEAVLVNEILDPLTDTNCPQLRNKPKLVFFQACRGDHYQDQTQTDAPPPPVFRDFLIGYPTQKDYRSFRNTVHGSWYINALVQVFMESAHDTSLSDMMNMVTGRVSSWTTDTGHPDSHLKGQTATYTSHLTKSLYFFPGIVAENDNR